MMKFYVTADRLNVNTKIVNQQNKGFVMLTVLIFMVILMIVAIASMRSTKDEISIAGSRYFRNQAYQSAQSTLVLAERCISTPTACGQAVVPNFDGTVAGWLDSSTPSIEKRNANKLIDPISWSAASTISLVPASDTFIGASSAREPMYTIEQMEKQVLPGGSVCDGCTGQELSLVRPFRLTARGFSPNDGSTVVLQRHILKLTP
jgi:Tfp pilus assembly protein PilX